LGQWRRRHTSQVAGGAIQDIGVDVAVVGRRLDHCCSTPPCSIPAAAAVAFVAPSILIGVVATAITTPAAASGFLGTYGILGLIVMYLMANVALIVEWAKFRARGIHKSIWLWSSCRSLASPSWPSRSGATCGQASRARTTSCRG
jgi:hypothetical protein